jgi:hypothetical protein
MLCGELERLEGQLDEIITLLETPGLSAQQTKALEDAYAKLSHTIHDHQTFGHDGGPCFEE